MKEQESIVSNIKKGLISFATPVWNEAAGIERYLESCLQFSDILDEVCIVDHRSSDGSGDVVKRYIKIYKSHGITLKLERQERDFDRSFTFADIRNQTMDMCTNKYIFFHDADFVFGPGYRTIIESFIQFHAEDQRTLAFGYVIPICRNILQLEGTEIRNTGYTRIHEPVQRCMVNGAGRWDYKSEFEKIYSSDGSTLKGKGLASIVPDSLLSIDIKDSTRALQRTTMNIYMQNREKLGGKPWLESLMPPREDLSHHRPSEKFPHVELEGCYKIDIGKFTKGGKYYEVKESLPLEIAIPTDPWQFIDHVYYINLDKREDRRIQVEGELEKLGVPSEKLTRVSAADHTKYQLRSQRGAGCTKSHLEAWTAGFKAGHQTILVLEDDFQLIMDPDAAKNIISQAFTLFPNFTVCNLGYSIRGSYGSNYDMKFGFKQCYSAQTTSAYIIRAKTLPMLVPIINHSYDNLMKGQDYSLNAIDQVWKYVQRIDNQWILAPKISKQRDSYSDIEASNMNYGT